MILVTYTLMVASTAPCPRLSLGLYITNEHPVQVTLKSCLWMSLTSEGRDTSTIATQKPGEMPL